MRGPGTPSGIGAGRAVDGRPGVGDAGQRRGRAPAAARRGAGMIRLLSGMGNLLLDGVGLLLALAALAAYPLLPFSDSATATQLFLVGIVLVLGAFAGHFTSRLALPRITGCIFIGCLVSPSLPELLRGFELFRGIDLPVLIAKEQAGSLKLINDLAIGLIALMAGAEIRVGWLRARLKAISARR